ncbi:hypothetical protein [Microbispora bryophytorum]|uniref:Uncharacterized protein n=1 Tax=Microbispora bryophytorum subsp. camponoti TaxID=1677852 RepID=A0ABR8KTA1_9ACTN|nr:hypothetical protein [Microbispora camponoti]MBD3141967.1 hypothetical protein [Microbispora camponoti]
MHRRHRPRRLRHRHGLHGLHCHHRHWLHCLRHLHWHWLHGHRLYGLRRMPQAPVRRMPVRPRAEAAGVFRWRA